MSEEVIEAVLISPRPILLDTGMPVRQMPLEVDALSQPAGVLDGIAATPSGGNFYVGPTARFHSLTPSGIALEILDTTTTTWTEVWRYEG